MRRCFILMFACAMALALPMQVMADETVSLKVGYQMLRPSGTFAGSDGGFGTSIDIEDDLDFDDSEEITAELALQFGNFRFSAGYIPLNFSGTSTLNKEIVFNGEAYLVGDTVEGNIDIDLYDIGLTWYLINFDDLPVRLQLGPEIAVKIVDGEASVESKTTPGLKENVSGTVGAPTIGARMRVGLSDFFALVGRVAYSEYSGNSLLDADTQLEFSPVPFMGVYGGYRYFDIDVDESDIMIDATFEGPYAGALMRF